MRGTLDFRIGDAEDRHAQGAQRRRRLPRPRSIWHGDSNFIGDDEYDEVWILDVFAPPRDRARRSREMSRR